MMFFFIFCSLADVESLYVGGDYEKVIQDAPFVLMDTTLLKSEIIEINKYYASSLAILGKREEAIKVFRHLLDLQPDFDLNPIEISPKIVNIFNEAKNEKQLLMAAVSSQKDTIYIETRIPLTVLIPGLTQIHANKKAKGYTILITEIVSLTALGVSQFYYTKYHNEYLSANTPGVITEKYRIYNHWYQRRAIFISTSTLIWLYNVIDGVWRRH